MYINDVHILYYVLAGIMGALVGLFTNWCNYRLPEKKKIFSKEIFMKKHRVVIKSNYIIVFVNALLYIALLYFFGIHTTLFKNLNLIKFGLLIPMLLSALIIDYRLQIIPNRLNLTMFEIGLVLTFLYGISNINIALNMLLGMIVGARNIFNYNFARWINSWKRSYGIWRCQINGSTRIILWIF